MVERLEDLFHRSARLPLTGYALVDRKAFRDLMDEMQTMIPEEVREAKRIVDDRDRMLNQAREEAERITTRAQQEAVHLLSREGRVQAAESMAGQIVAQARADGERLTAGANEYVISVLAELDRELNSIVATTRNGIAHLQGQLTPVHKEDRIEPGEK